MSKYRITPLWGELTDWVALWDERKAKRLAELEDWLRRRFADPASELFGREMARMPLEAAPEGRMVVPLEAAARALGKTPEELIEEAAQIRLNELALRAVLEAAYGSEVTGGEIRVHREGETFLSLKTVDAGPVAGPGFTSPEE